MDQAYKNAIAQLELASQNVPSSEIVVLDKQGSRVQTTDIQKFEAGENNTMLPVRGTTRSSIPENSVGGLMAKNMALPPDFPVEYLVMLEHFAVYNRHVSYAIENIITLSNTPYKIEFADKTPVAMQRKMMDYLKGRMDKWYEFSDGTTSLINDLFAQAAINGAISFEAIPDPKLMGVKKVVRVSPKSIRFIYDIENDVYNPFQLIRNLNSTVGMPNRKTVNGMIQLNPATYTYIAMRRFNESPYGVPPFLSAIEDLITEYDMVGNFKSMMKRLGILGFLSVLVKAPKQLPGEGPEEYTARLTRYLDSLAPEVNKQMANGVAIGFQDTHSFELEGNNMNVAGAENLMKMVKGLVYAGLKQDPNMHGENYSVTETFGRVILAKLTTQMKNYQRSVAMALEKIILMDLVLGGFHPGFVSVCFEPAMVGDMLKDAQVEQIKIANVIAKFNQGLIDQDDAAQELGYEAPAMPGPIAQAAPGAAPAPAANDKGSSNPSADKSANSKTLDVFNSADLDGLIGKITLGAPEFDYGPDDCCGGDHNHVPNYSANNELKKLDDFIGTYNNEIALKYRKAIAYTASDIGEAIKNASGEISKTQFKDMVTLTLYKGWQGYFKDKIKADVKNNVAEVYGFYRKDKTPFTTGRKKGFAKESFFTPPDSIFGLLDFKTIQFFEGFDNLYLGKFVADEDTRKRIQAWIEEYYIQNDNAIGKNDKAIADFKAEFADFMGQEDWKIRRIVETSVNKARNYASTNYLSQAQVEEYEIVEVLDRLSCQYCESMNGKTFSVSKSVEIIDKIANGEPGDVKSLTPFATTIPIDEFTKMSEDELQASGICLPSFHPHCRGRVIALF